MDYGRLEKMNPALLARRIKGLEDAISRQFALNDAAAHRLLAMQDELAQKGAFIVALVKKLGGRFELSVADMQELQGANMSVRYFYPDDKDPSFRMVLVAQSDEQVASTIEAKLRRAGLGEDEIAALKKKLDEADEDARRLFETELDIEAQEPPAQPAETPSSDA